jgi:hypothetical protein
VSCLDHTQVYVRPLLVPPEPVTVTCTSPAAWAGAMAVVCVDGLANPVPAIVTLVLPVAGPETVAGLQRLIGSGYRGAGSSALRLRGIH